MRRASNWVFAGAVSILLSGVAHAHAQTSVLVDQSAETIKLRATATVLVDGEEYSGSAVQEFQLQWVLHPELGTAGAWRVASRGEAILVDIPGGKPVFVLMSASNSNGNYGFLVEAQCTDREGSVERQKESFLQLDHCDLSAFPKAVRLDPNDRSSGEAVYVDGAGRNGYDFVAMTFERTEDETTKGVIPRSLSDKGARSIRIPFEKFIAVVGDLEFASEVFW